MSINFEPAILKKSRGILNQDTTNPHQIIPIMYQWARRYYQAGIANNWVPEEIGMQTDIEQWKNNTVLSDEERRIVLYSLGFFSTAESLTANNIVLALFKHVTNPECRQYMLRQAFEEAIHTDTFIYCCDTLALNPEEIYTAYMSIPSIKQKDDFVIKITEDILDPHFKITDKASIRKFIHNAVGFYVIMEGIFFYAGFAMMLGLKRHNKMVGIGQQFEYIMRDESIHLAFGCDLINTVIAENPGVWTEEFQQEIVELIKEAVYLECVYIEDACPKNFFGFYQEQFIQYIQYIADRRLERLNLAKEYNVENPFPWMSQATDLSKEKNFFETRVTEYQSAGSLDW
jgi:ribonucleoside-diphosphate reductase beta chain